MSENQQEEKNRRVAWVISITLHVALLVAFIFMVAWREPNPPYPEYGIEVNFGTSTIGKGEIQPTEPVNSTESEEEAQPEEASEEVIDEVMEEIVEAIKESAAAQEAQVITQPEESPDVIEEVIKEEVVKPKEKKVVEEVIDKPVEEIKPVVKNPIVYKKNDGANGTTGESAVPKNSNQGDDPTGVGDKGNVEGTLDARTLYGNSGGGGGAPALTISGWFWDEIPNKKDASSENGLVEFSFVVDSEGYVGSIQVVRTTVSPAVVNFYKEQLRKTTFSQTNPNVAPLAQTKGTVTFVIKSR